MDGRTRTIYSSASVAEDEAMTEESSEELTEAYLGAVLRLSRANVPATIPLHQG